MRRIKSFCVARPSHPHFPRAGETTSASDSGSPTLEHPRKQFGATSPCSRVSATPCTSRVFHFLLRARGPPSFRNVQLDRQVLTEEEAASPRLLAGVVQGVSREAGLALGGRWCLHLEVEAADLIRLGLVALRRLQQPRGDRPPLGPCDPDPQAVSIRCSSAPCGPRRGGR